MPWTAQTLHQPYLVQLREPKSRTLPRKAPDITHHPNSESRLSYAIGDTYTISQQGRNLGLALKRPAQCNHLVPRLRPDIVDNIFSIVNAVYHAHAASTPQRYDIEIAIFHAFLELLLSSLQVRLLHDVIKARSQLFSHKGPLLSSTGSYFACACTSLAVRDTKTGLAITNVMSVMENDQQS